MKKQIQIIALLLISSFSVFSQSPASLDQSFNLGGTASFFIPMNGLPQISCKHLVQPNGKIVICSNSVIGITTNELMVTRLNSNGSLDLTFGNSGTFNHSIVTGFNLAVGLVIQPDGKLVTAGMFNDGSGINGNEIFIIRLNTNGTFDNSFGANGISTFNFSPDNERVTDLKILPDGSFVISGAVLDSGFVVKTTPTGSLDSSFATNGFFEYQHNASQTDFYSLEVLADKSIIVAGSYNSASNYQDVLAIKLDSTGAFNNNFATGGIYTRDVFNDYDEIHALKILSNNDILLAGYSYDGNNDGSLVIKLNSAGSEITSFGNSGISSYVFTNTPSRMYDMDVQSDGKIVLAGEYGDTISGLYDFMILRLLANGTPDTSFNNSLPYVTTDFLAEDDNSSSVVIQPDGKILVYGTAQLNPTTQEDSPSLARYMGNLPTGISTINSDNFSVLFPNPTHNSIQINIAEQLRGSTFTIHNQIGQVVTHFTLDNVNNTINLKNIARGFYTYNILLMGNIVKAGKIVVE